MSNTGTDNLIEHIIDEVDKIWLLDKRDDLKNDCQKFVYENYEVGNGQLGLDIKDLVIAFLSEKCADAMSEADLDAMAMEDQERCDKEITYEHMTQGV